MRQRDIGDAVALVEFQPHELFRVRGVLDVVSYEAVIRGVMEAQIENSSDVPALSGKTATSPAEKSKVRDLESPMKTLARPVPLWK